MAEDFKYEIVQNLGVLSEGKGGWKTELNLVSWNGNPAKYDLRAWAPDHQKMGKGLTFTKDDLISLRDLLNGLEL